MATTSLSSTSRQLWDLAARQHGVVARSQLVAAGLGPEAIRHRLRIGRLHALLRGVYAVGRPHVGREGRWMAATLACGGGAGLSHLPAAQLWGIRLDPLPAALHVTVPRGVRRTCLGVCVHTAAPAQAGVVKHRGIPVVSPVEVLLNLATTSEPRQLERDINAADIHGLISVEKLRASLTGRVRRPGVVALREIIVSHSFTLTDSELERMFLPLASSAGLPVPQTRRRVNGFRVDFFWPSLGLIVETDGLRYHRTPAQQARDLVRDQTHRAAGLEPLRFTHWQVTHDKRWVLRTLRRVAARLGD